MINLSSLPLSDDQLKVLSYGLKFTPTPHPDSNKLQEEVNTFCRSIRLKELFHDYNDGSYNANDHIGANKSNFMPRKGRDLYLEQFIDNIQRFPQTRIECVKSNLTPNEKGALQLLRDNEDIVVKEADKGGTVIIMDTDYYAYHIQAMLNDMDTYARLNSSPNAEFLADMRKLVLKFKGILSDKEIDYILNFNMKDSNFYGLPKVHKCQDILNAIANQNSEFIVVHRPESLTFRPIVGGPMCLTSRLSETMDFLLKPLLQHVPSSVRDGTDFLNNLPKSVEEDCLLTTFDISSLYSNIPHDLGLKAIEYWLNTFPDTIPRKDCKNLILECTRFILEHNVFLFNDAYFLQILGTAMGTKMAPTYATLTIAYLERTLYEQINEKYGEVLKGYFVCNWKRYLDDCFIIWPTRYGDVSTLHDILQSLHPYIKFTCEKSNTCIPFLDISITLNAGRIITDIYHKPTDSRQYLHFNSCHPRHTRTNVPYCLARRVCTIVTDPNLRDIRLEELRRSLSSRGYPYHLINDALLKAKSQDISVLRSTREKEAYNALLFISTHNPNNVDMFPIIKANTNVLQGSSRMKQVLEKSKLRKGTRQAPNLKRMLVKSNFSSQKQTYNVSKCNDKRCGTCNIIREGSSYTFAHNNLSFQIRANLSCASKNVIYVLECSTCQSAYIGQTSAGIRARVRVHKSQIINDKYRFLPVSNHIHTCGNNEFTIMPIFQCVNGLQLTVKEEALIKWIKPPLNAK